MSISWAEEQNKKNTLSWQTLVELYYPATASAWTDPEEYLHCLKHRWTSLDAVKIIPWERYIRPGMKILDLGGGTGWVSALLSKYATNGKIYCLDSSDFLLNKMLPTVVKGLGGDIRIIEPITGLFSPLLLEDCSLDVIVACASMHHAENIESVFAESHRVLKKGGLLFILNENEYSYFYYLYRISRAMIKIVFETLFKRYHALSPSVSASGYLYDPYLGDRIYPFWYIKKALVRTGFRLVNRVETPFRNAKDVVDTGRKLFHFICERT